MSSARPGFVLAAKADDACLMMDTTNFNPVNFNIPSTFTVIPGGTYCAPRDWAERSDHIPNHHHAVDKDGHFATCEPPELFTEEIREAFKSLR